MKKLILACLLFSLCIAPCVVYGQDIQETKQEQKVREKREKEEAKQQKKAEEKKRKEEEKKKNAGKPKWSGMPDKMSGVPEIDSYIVKVDSVYSFVNVYIDSINAYTRQTVPLLDADGNQVRSADGQAYLKTVVVDREGNGISVAQSLLLLPEMSTALLGLTSEAVGIVAGGVSATAALVSNPMLAFSYAKYVRDAPGVLKYIGEEGVRLGNLAKSQSSILLKLRGSQVSEDLGLGINTDEAIINTAKDYEEATGVDDILQSLGIE